MSRLIDADALIKDMGTCCNRSQFGRATAKMCVKRAHTVDAVAVVRGKWEERYKSGTVVLDGYVCSVCDCWGKWESNYCPNCGAKMEVKDEN